MWSVEKLGGCSDDGCNARNDIHGGGMLLSDPWWLPPLPNAAPDVGDGHIPDMSRKGVPEFFRNRRKAINRFGFGFLTLGSAFQNDGRSDGILPELTHYRVPASRRPGISQLKVECRPWRTDG
jgi:hypothetical protein